MTGIDLMGFAAGTDPCLLASATEDVGLKVCG
jgi:hypothetical protein